MYATATSHEWMSSNERQEAVMEERRRFADELHDVVASSLQSAALFLAAAEQSIPLEAGEAALEFLHAAEAEIRVCWEDARRSATGLRPLELERRGLAGALAGFARRLSRTAAVTVTFVIRGAPCALSEPAELAVLRVGQEAVTNALRHSGAKAVSVELSYDADAVRLEVTDNGSGFDLQSTVPHGGWQSMRDRVEEIGAELSILAAPGAGTQIIMTVPLFARGADRPETYLG